MYPWHSPADWANWEKELVNEKFWEKPKQFSPQKDVKYTPLHPPGLEFHTALKKLKEIWDGGWELRVKLLRSVNKLNIKL